MVIEYWKTKDKQSCCGCRACEQVCSRKALTMEADEEGFLYPDLKIDACVDCGKCKAVCPVEHRPAGNSPINAYAVQHKDTVILAKSSSGGVFRMLADKILSLGGCVVGCRWSANNRPALAIAEDIDSLAAMQGSKYLFSDTDLIYSKVKHRLSTGQTVLFTGAPCQCAALQNFLGGTYDNLIIAEFLCHGMPSQQIFDAYVQAIERKLQTSIYDIHFRDKRRRGWGLAFSYKYKQGKTEKYRSNIGLTDPYLFGYLQGYYNRYICYRCPFRGEKRVADITFCDYWGAEQEPLLLNSFSIELGISAVTANTPKGCSLLKGLDSHGLWLQTTPEKIANGNHMLLNLSEEQVPALRHQIYRFVQESGWDEIAHRFLRVDKRTLRVIWYSIPVKVAKTIRKLLRAR